MGAERPYADLFVALYNDEDVTSNLTPALRRRGYMCESTTEAGNIGLQDEAQLLYAAERGLAILTYNAQDFPAGTGLVLCGSRTCWYHPFRAI